MLRYFFCLVFFLFCLTGLNGQLHQYYTFSHMGDHDGLASNDIRSVAQDEKGYMWIGTTNGLQRYDGHRFVSFRHKNDDPFSIINNKIFDLQTDNENRLWIHFGDNSMGYMNVSDFKFHETTVKYDNNILKRSQGNMFQGENETMVLLLFKHAILTYNKTNNEFSEANTPFALPANWHPQWFFYDEQRNADWIACDSGLVKYNLVTKKISYRGHNEENDEIINVFGHFTFISHPYFDRSGRFWMDRWSVDGSGPYLHCYNTVTKITLNWDTRLNLKEGEYHEIHNIQEQDDGSIWLVGRNLMARLEKSSKDFELIPSNQSGEFSIRYDYIKTLFQDREKNIWACTDKGLYRFNPSAQMFKIIPNQRISDDHIYTPDVTDILQTSAGDILVSTWGNGTFSYDNNFTPTNLGYAKPMHLPGEDMTWALLQRKNGDIWRTCQDGFIIITSAASKKTIRINPPIFQSTIRQIIEDNNGDLWFGTHNGKLIKWEEATNNFQLINQTTTVNRLYKDKKGDIWVCTGADGIYKVNPGTNAITAQYTSNGPEGSRLMSPGASDVIQYNDSIYIIGSETLNLLNIKTGQIRFYGLGRSEFANSAENFIVDNKGYIWYTDEGTLCRLYLEKDITSTFNENDGLSPGYFNIASANMLSDGRIAIGRTHDFIVFDPEAIDVATLTLPKPEITAFLLMNQRLAMDSLQKLPEVELRYNQNSVIIEFSTMTYLNSFPIMYMMKGLDKDWNIAGSAREVVYNYLPPGDYTFMMKCTNGEGGFSDITSIKITVKAPFWKTWWFYCLLVLLVAALFYWIDRERMRRKAAIQKMRGDIAGNLHEEINIALNNINVLSEIARIKADKEPEQSKNYIAEIHHKSHNMIIAMDDMLWSINPENDKMSKTIDRIKEFADALRNRHAIKIELQTDEKVVSLKPDMKIRHELLLIYKLALRMLVEELGAKETLIHLGYVSSQLQLTIFSLGVSLNDNNNTTIKTMEEMKAKADMIGASLEFQTDEKGIAITLAVKTI